MIAVTAVVTLSLSKGSSSDNNAKPAAAGGASQSPTAASNIASANDTGPATLITDDPTCAAWLTVDKGVGAAEQKTDWTNHDYKAPVAEWTPELRQTYATISNAMTSAADQTVALVSKTPHRVMRELYEQFIAHAREFAKSLDTYTEVDQHLANASVLARSALDYACASIDWKAVATRGPFVVDPAPPTKVATPGDPSNPQRAITSPMADCEEWATLIDTFNTDIKEWGISTRS